VKTSIHIRELLAGMEEGGCCCSCCTLLTIGCCSSSSKEELGVMMMRVVVVSWGVGCKGGAWRGTKEWGPLRTSKGYKPSPSHRLTPIMMMVGHGGSGEEEPG
jgi:hypothetical protein